MQNIKFRKHDGPVMDVFVIKREYQGMVASALMVSGYVLEVSEIGNPWEAVNYEVLDLVTAKNDGGAMLLVTPERYGSEAPVDLVMKAIDIYAPHMIEDTWRSMHRPVHYETQDW